MFLRWALAVVVDAMPRGLAMASPIATPSARSSQRQLQKQNPALGRAGGYGRAILLNSRISASAWRSSMFRARSCWRTLPLSALRATLALPAALVGPVDRSHGLQRLMASACRCLRSGVQGVAMLRLQ